MQHAITWNYFTSLELCQNAEKMIGEIIIHEVLDEQAAEPRSVNAINVAESADATAFAGKFHIIYKAQQCTP